MAAKRLQYRVTSGRYTLLGALLMTVLCRLLARFVLPVSVTAEEVGSRMPWGTCWQMLPEFVALWGGLLVYVLTAYLLILLNNTYGLIRQRASFQSAVYLLLVSLCPDLYGLQAGHVAGVSIVGSLFFLFRAYRSSSAPTDLFLATACMGAGALFVPCLTFLLPIYWIGAYSLQALSWRGFFASLLGWMFPFWFLLGHAYFYGDMQLFVAPFAEMLHFTTPFQGFNAGRLWTFVYLFILFLVSACHVLLHGLEDKIRTRCCLRFFVLLGVCLFLCVGLQPTLYAALLPVLAACVGVLAGHFFVLTRGRLANIFFVVVLLAGLALYLINLWMLS